MMTGNTAIHIASQLQSGAPRKAAFLVAVRLIGGRFPIMERPTTGRPGMRCEQVGNGAKAQIIGMQ